jgi:hypothetical protein
MGLVRIAGIAGEVNVPTEMVPIAATFDLGTLDISKLQTDVFTRPFAMAMEAGDGPRRRRLTTRRCTKATPARSSRL